jgi:membrane protein YdbS with pleckstrin-like domain
VAADFSAGLAFDLKNNTIAAMKFALAILVYLIIAVILGAGILEVMAGKPWLLAAGAVAFIVAFGRIGCMPKKPH